VHLRARLTGSHLHLQPYIQLTVVALGQASPSGNEVGAVDDVGGTGDFHFCCIYIYI